MNYLERNRAIIAEIQSGISLKRGQLVGTSKSHGTTFTTCGACPSKVLGRNLFLGIKEFPKTGNPRWDQDHIIDRTFNELPLVSAIFNEYPYLREKMPLFHALLIDSNGIPQATLTEDFSKGGTNSVSPGVFYNIDPKRLSEDLSRLTGLRVYAHDIQSLCFGIYQERVTKLGDFDLLATAYYPKGEIPEDEYKLYIVTKDIT